MRPGYNIFQCGLDLIDYCNFSWTPYFYDSKFGKGQRVFKVFAKHTKTRLVIHIVQIVFLFVWLSRTLYNGLIVTNEPAEEERKLRKDLNENFINVTNIFMRSYYRLSNWGQYIVLHNHWTHLGVFSRHVNVLVLLFTINTLLQRIYSLLRRQQSDCIQFKKYEPDGGSGPKMLSTWDKQEIWYNSTMRYKEFFLGHRLSLRNYLKYCFTNTPLDKKILDKYPILKEMTLQEILDFDLTSIHYDNKILCSSRLFRKLMRATVLAIPCIPYVSLSIWTASTTVEFSRVGFQISSFYDVLAICWKRMDLLLITSMNVITLADAYLPVLVSSLLADRLGIYNLKLARFIHQCHIKRFAMHFNGDHKLKQYITGRCEATNYYMKKRFEKFKNHDKSNVKLTYADIKDFNLDEECFKLIITLNHLIDEFKLFKTAFSDRTDVDLAVSLFSVAWLTSIAIISIFTCPECKNIKMMAGMVITPCLWGYGTNIISQIIFYAHLSQKVDNHINIHQQSIYLFTNL